ncbi:hypothetical protein O0L34_g15348 [Tuta absoluta]|nr:hypothetical protein O0L34_g19415 [Tuta absoluta]KAJ2940315.1 hypothetical protein O0L34_g11899 [Tuta absoluta]KAJ2949430.1 hypothetical protein O0L34_g15348 [Tuta absoluta]
MYVQRSPPTTGSSGSNTNKNDALTEKNNTRSSPVSKIPRTAPSDQLFSPEKTSQYVNNNPRNNKRNYAEMSPNKEHQDKIFQDSIRNMMNDFMSKQSTILTKLQEDVQQIKAQNQIIVTSNAEIQTSINGINHKIEAMTDRVASLEKERKEYQDTILLLEKKISILENTSRPSAIEIRNIPYQNTEKIEDLITFTMELGKTLQVDIKQSDIRDIRRVSIKPTSKKPVCVEFNSVQVKTKLLQAVRTFNKSRANSEKLNTIHIGIVGTNEPVYVSEYLPAEDRKLFYQAKQFIKNHGFKFCWSSHGRIYIQKNENSKAIKIMSMKTLEEIEPKEEEE